MKLRYLAEKHAERSSDYSTQHEWANARANLSIAYSLIRIWNLLEKMFEEKKNNANI